MRCAAPSVQQQPPDSERSPSASAKRSVPSVVRKTRKIGSPPALRLNILGNGHCRDSRRQIIGLWLAQAEGYCLFIPNGTNRARTCDLMRVKHALFQLSYDPAIFGTPHFELD